MHSAQWHNSESCEPFALLSPRSVILESPAVMLRKCRYAFLTLPNYSLDRRRQRLWNPCAWPIVVVGNEDVYEWSVISMDGRVETRQAADSHLPAHRQLSTNWVTVDILFVCGGVNVREAVSPGVIDGSANAWLIDACRLGALCTGGYALAKRRIVGSTSVPPFTGRILSALREEFPRVRISDQAVHHRPRSIYLLRRAPHRSISC
jgi:hypothetical protein